MARPARPEQSKSARSSRQFSRFYHSINPDRVFGTHSGWYDCKRRTQTFGRKLSTHVRCQHDHLGADPHTIVEIDHVVIDHSNTAGGNVAPDLPGLVCAMNAVQGVLVALPQVKRAGTEWTVGPSGHALAARQFLQTCCELGVSFENFFGGIPVRPFLLAVDHGHTGPAKSFAADGNSITPSLSTALHVVEVMVQWIHNDGAARLSRGVLNVCPAVGGIDLRQASRRARAAGETQHRTGGRSTRNQDATAQNAHIIKVEPTRFRNQEVLYRSIPSLASSPKSGSFCHGRLCFYSP